MKNTTALLTITALALVSLPMAANAQQDTPGSDTTKSAAKSEAKDPTVTVDVRDARLRDVLEMLFKQAKVNYQILPGVDGFVTMKVANLSFEAALKLTLRSGSVPLVYNLENGVYIVKPRPVEEVRTVTVAPPSYPETNLASNTPRFEVIQLMYADPADFAQLLNITLLPTGARFGNPTFGGMGGVTVGGGGLGGFGTGNGAGNNRGNNSNGGGSGRVGTPGGRVVVSP